MHHASYNVLLIQRVCVCLCILDIIDIRDIINIIDIIDILSNFQSVPNHSLFRQMGMSELHQPFWLG